MKRIMIIRRETDSVSSESSESLKKRVESLFGRTYIELPASPPSTKDILQKGFFRGTNRLYEMEGGAVLYQEFLIRDNSYAANIILVGFDEKSETYQKLKNNLEGIALKNPENTSRMMQKYPRDINEIFGKYLKEHSSVK